MDRQSIDSLNGSKSMGRTSLEGKTSMSSLSSKEPEPTEFGASNYAAKKKAVEDYYDNTITAENIEEMTGALSKFFREDAPKAARRAGYIVADALTPGFIKRYRASKIHAKEVEDREG